MKQACWHGLGPHENYPDRCSSAWVSQHRLPVEKLSTPYVVPSENGHRCGVRWLSLEDEAGCGLWVGGSGLFGFSAGRSSLAALEAAEHTNVLEPLEGKELHLHLDHKMAGVAPSVRLESRSKSRSSSVNPRRGARRWFHASPNRLKPSHTVSHRLTPFHPVYAPMAFAVAVGRRHKLE